MSISTGTASTRWCRKARPERWWRSKTRPNTRRSRSGWSEGRGPFSGSGPDNPPSDRVRSGGKILSHRNPPSPLRGTPGPRKLAAWSGPRRLTAIKRVARLADATVNDVLIAAVSGAIHRYLVDHWTGWHRPPAALRERGLRPDVPPVRGGGERLDRGMQRAGGGQR